MTGIVIVSEFHREIKQFLITYRNKKKPIYSKLLLLIRVHFYYYSRKNNLDSIL